MPPCRLQRGSLSYIYEGSLRSRKLAKVKAQFYTLNMIEKDRNLRILSLDGGGFRGLSSLLILKSMMTKIRSRADRAECKLEDEPRPCDYFDYISGTGIGGVIALLLGRLKLTVSECMLAYRDLSSLVLRDRGCSPLFDLDKLLHVAKGIVSRYEEREGDDHKAETIAFAVEKEQKLLCIYSIDEQLSDLDTKTPLHELIAALMAAKGLLGEYTMKNKHGNNVTFLDRPYPWGCSNPASEVICAVIKRERQKKALRPVSQPHPSYNTILVSVGTGKVAKEDVGDLAVLGHLHGLSLFDIGKPWKYLSMAKSAADIIHTIFSPQEAVISVAKTQEFAQDEARLISASISASSQLGRCDIYRFEIEPVLDVGPNDFRSVKEVGEETKTYLGNTGQRLETLIGKIVEISERQ